MCLRRPPLSLACNLPDAVSEDLTACMNEALYRMEDAGRQEEQEHRCDRSGASLCLPPTLKSG